MQLPLLGRLSDIIRYDRHAGLIYALDWNSYPNRISFISCGDNACLGAVITETLRYDSRVAACLSGYGLALTAHAWHGRPSDAGRAALIQACEQLRISYPGVHQIHHMVTQALAQADAAILAGADAEEALLHFVTTSIRQADKLAERCGRSAAELLAPDDHVFVCGYPGAAFVWMLSVAHQQDSSFQISAVEQLSLAHQDQLVARLCDQVAQPVALLQHDMLETRLAQSSASICLIGASAVQSDGSVVTAARALQCAKLARQHNVPLYVFGYEGIIPNQPGIQLSSDEPVFVPPDGSKMSMPALAAFAPQIIPAHLISAIITGRGIYRPERIADSLGDGLAPLDVIPLT